VPPPKPKPKAPEPPPARAAAVAASTAFPDLGSSSVVDVTPASAVAAPEPPVSEDPIMAKLAGMFRWMNDRRGSRADPHDAPPTMPVAPAPSIVLPHVTPPAATPPAASNDEFEPVPGVWISTPSPRFDLPPDEPPSPSAGRRSPPVQGVGEPSTAAPGRWHHGGATPPPSRPAPPPAPAAAFKIQMLDPKGPWHDCGLVGPSGIRLGRGQCAADFPGRNSLAAYHLRIREENGRITLEDLGGLNGVYRRIVEPVALADGLRFRIGGQTLEFHEAGPLEPVPAARTEDGEEFCSRDLAPLAFIDLIRPNGRPGLRFPITRTDSTVIGREGPGAQIALTDDHAVNASHAKLQRQDERFFLHDLRSRTGTFVQIRGTTEIKPGELLLAGAALFRVVAITAG
jgi:pSer/pThr/pTyr-binding forkhead associated (FHA) protein